MSLDQVIPELVIVHVPEALVDSFSNEAPMIEVKFDVECTGCLPLVPYETKKAQ